MTQIELKTPQRIELVKSVSNADSTINHTTNKKGKLKGGSLVVIDEVKDEYQMKLFIIKTYESV